MATEITRGVARVCAVGWFGLLMLGSGSVPAAAPLPVIRDEQGDPLPPHALARLGTVRLRTAKEIYSVDWSPDGRHFASGGRGGSVKVWDASTGRLLAVPSHTGGYQVRFAPTGAFLASTGMSLEFFRGRNFQPPAFRSLGREDSPGWGDHYQALAFSLDGRLAATVVNMSALVVYHVEDGKVLWRSEHPDRRQIGPVAFSPDGKLLASADQLSRPAGLIRLWDARTGREVGQFAGQLFFPISLVFTSSGDTLISSSSDGIRFWDLASRKEKRLLADRGQLLLSRDGRLLAAYRADLAGVRLYDPESGKLVRTLECGSALWSAAFSPDDKTLLVGDYRSLRLWDVATGREVRPRPGHHDAVFCVRFSPDGKTLATRSADQTVRLWDRAAAQQRLSLPIGDSGRHLEAGGRCESGSLAFSPDGRTLAAVEGAVGPESGDRGSDVLLWDLSDPRAPRRIRESTGLPYGIAFSPDGRVRATAAGMNGVHLWNEAGKLLAELLDPDPSVPATRDPRLGGRAVVFSPDGRTLAVATESAVLLWDYQDRRLLRTLTGPAGATHLAFSPTGHLLAATGYDTRSTGPNPAQVWEVVTGQPVATLAPVGAPHWAVLHGLSFSPDGRLLAAGDSLGNVRFWDLGMCKELACWPGHQGHVYSVDFAPDGAALASAGQDTTVLVWDTRSLQPSLSRSSARLEELAAELASKDAPKAYASVWALVGRGEATVAHLRTKLRPVPREDAEAVHRWIAQLDDDLLPKRDEASAALERMGQSVQGWLQRALANKPSAEARRRLTRLLRQLEGAPPLPAEWQQGRALLVLELIGSESARALLGELGKGDPQATLTRAAKAACDRLARRGR